MHIVKSSRLFDSLGSKFSKKNKQPNTDPDMIRLFMQLLEDPNVAIDKPDKKQRQTIYYRGRNIGWVNPQRGDVWVDRKVYNQLKSEATPRPGVSEVSRQSKLPSDELIQASSDIDSTHLLEKAIKDIIDEDMCISIVNLAFSADGKTFADEQFMESDDFFDTYLSNEDPEDVALKFFNGKDLDSRGQANPNREYLRFDKKENIESTDDPGAIYYDILLDDIIDYVMDHLDDTEYPEEIQELIDEYLANTLEEDDTL